MPVKITKVDGYRVTHGGKVSAKKTTKEKAEKQRRLLESIRRSGKPFSEAQRKKRHKRIYGSKSKLPKRGSGLAREAAKHTARALSKK